LSPPSTPRDIHCSRQGEAIKKIHEGACWGGGSAGSDTQKERERERERRGRERERGESISNSVRKHLSTRIITPFGEMMYFAYLVIYLSLVAGSSFFKSHDRL
jgi:hypothetical protein